MRLDERANESRKKLHIIRERAFAIDHQHNTISFQILDMTKRNMNTTAKTLNRI